MGESFEQKLLRIEQRHKELEQRLGNTKKDIEN
jgi:hypothetical protein